MEISYFSSWKLFFLMVNFKNICYLFVKPEINIYSVFLNMFSKIRNSVNIT